MTSNHGEGNSRSFTVSLLSTASLLAAGMVALGGAACTLTSSTTTPDGGTADAATYEPEGNDAAPTTQDAGVVETKDAAVTRDGALPVDAADAAAANDAHADTNDAAVVLPPGLLGPTPYLSRKDSPFNGVAFPSYFHFEDWEDHALNTPGVTADSSTLASSFGAGLIDSIDGDDGAVDGKCQKSGGDTCDDLWASGTVTFTFDDGALGALPTHVGIVWTDGATACDAIFEAYDATNTLLGSKTATAIGDNSNSGTVDEDRFFGIVATGGVKKIVVKSSSGGVEVDHLQYGR